VLVTVAPDAEIVISLEVAPPGRLPRKVCELRETAARRAVLPARLRRVNPAQSQRGVPGVSLPACVFRDTGRNLPEILRMGLNQEYRFFSSGVLSPSTHSLTNSVAADREGAHDSRPEFLRAQSFDTPNRNSD